MSPLPALSGCRQVAAAAFGSAGLREHRGGRRETAAPCEPRTQHPAPCQARAPAPPCTHITLSTHCNPTSPHSTLPCAPHSRASPAPYSTLPAASGTPAQLRQDPTPQPLAQLCPSPLRPCLLPAWPLQCSLQHTGSPRAQGHPEGLGCCREVQAMTGVVELLLGNDYGSRDQEAAAQSPLDLPASPCPILIPWKPQGWNCPYWEASKAPLHTTSMSLMGCTGGSPGQKGPLAMSLCHSIGLGMVFCVMGMRSQTSAPAGARPRMGSGCEKGGIW